MNKNKTWLPLAAAAVMIAVSLFLMSGRTPKDTGPVEPTPLPFAAVEEKVAPAPQSLADDYFRLAVSYHPATAGASLGRAQAACGVLRFAAENEVRSADIPTLRDNMLVGWNSLSDQERKYFDSNFMELVQLLDECQKDWASNRPVFDDAGVAEIMDGLLADPAAIESWETLKAHTLTLGNSEA